MIFGTLFLGCPNPASDPEEDLPQILDKPTEGVMSKETADKVFKWEDVPETTGVEIIKFLSTEELEKYLNTSRAAAPLDGTLVIKEINGKPVIKIRGGAFTPSDPEGKDDITRVVGRIELPATIESLGEDLFKGVANPAFELVVPPAVQENPEIDLTAAVGDVEVVVVDSETGETIDIEEPEEPEEPEDPGEPNDLGEPNELPPIEEPPEEPTDTDTTPVVRPVNISAITGVVGPGADGSIVPASTITSTARFTGTVSWNPPISSSGVFAPGTLYTATITLTPKSGYTFEGVAADYFTVEGARASNAANSGTVTAVFTGIRADDVSSLNGAVTAAKSYNGGAVIYLSSAFYNSANTAGTAIVVDAGNTDNTIPYTIKGTGKNSGDSLTVGILLANDNVTLEGVKIAVTDPAKAAITQGTDLKRYTAAITIGRSADGTSFLTAEGTASKNVTVRNSDVTIDYSAVASMPSGYTHNAGIYICGNYDWSTNNRPKNITITGGNTISAKGYSTNAAQGLIMNNYDPSLVITNNTLKSETGGTQAVNGPAAGLFMTVNPASVMDSNTPQITGNTLDGKNIDFYVNILSSGNNDYTGVPALFNAKFGTYHSTWAIGNAMPAANSSFYKKLYDELIKQSDGDYAGLFFMMFGPGAAATPMYDGYCFTYEAWVKSGGAGNSGTITAVDYWGATIGNSGTDSAYDANGKDTDTKAGDTAHSASGKSGTAAGYRGRLVPDSSKPDGVDRDTQDFHWNVTDAYQGGYPKKGS
jgi:hypothetical protein